MGVNDTILLLFYRFDVFHKKILIHFNFIKKKKSLSYPVTKIYFPSETVPSHVTSLMVTFTGCISGPSPLKWAIMSRKAYVSPF